MPSAATAISRQRGKHRPTRSPGSTPKACNCAAKAPARRCSSRYVKTSAPDATAIASGRSAACPATISGTSLASRAAGAAAVHRADFSGEVVMSSPRQFTRSVRCILIWKQAKSAVSTLVSFPGPVSERTPGRPGRECGSAAFMRGYVMYTNVMYTPVRCIIGRPGTRKAQKALGPWVQKFLQSPDPIFDSPSTGLRTGLHAGPGLKERLQSPVGSESIQLSSRLRRKEAARHSPVDSIANLLHVDAHGPCAADGEYGDLSGMRDAKMQTSPAELGLAEFAVAKHYAGRRHSQIPAENFSQRRPGNDVPPAVAQQRE